MSDPKLDGQLALVAVVIGWEARHLAEHGREAHSLPPGQRPIAAAAIVLGFVLGFVVIGAATEDESLGVVGGVVTSNAALYAVEGWLRRDVADPKQEPTPSATGSPPATAQPASAPQLIAAPQRTAIPGAN